MPHFSSLFMRYVSSGDGADGSITVHLRCDLLSPASAVDDVNFEVLYGFGKGNLEVFVFEDVKATIVQRDSVKSPMGVYQHEVRGGSSIRQLAEFCASPRIRLTAPFEEIHDIPFDVGDRRALVWFLTNKVKGGRGALDAARARLMEQGKHLDGRQAVPE